MKNLAFFHLTKLTLNTLGKPGGQLFSSMRVDSLSYDRKLMPRCRCFSVNALTFGQPHTCFTDFPTPDVSLTRKVPPSLYNPLVLINFFCLRIISYMDIYGCSKKINYQLEFSKKKSLSTWIQLIYTNVRIFFLFFQVWWVNF